MMARLSARSVLLLSVGLLAACQPLREPEPETVQAPSQPAEDTEAGPGPEADDSSEQERRRLADTLYEGLRALRQDRLMTPPERSAYRYFSRALAFDPGNELALEGMQDIVERYLELSQQAAWQGRFDNAELYLRRAGQVDDEHSGIDETRNEIQRERERTHSVEVISRQELSAQSQALVSTLEKLAREAAQEELFVLITVPRDGQGRWIYNRMREAVEGQRLRANIEIGDQPAVRLVSSGSQGASD